MLRIRDLRRGDSPPNRARVAFDPEVVEEAQAVCSRIRGEGDRALEELTLRYDGANIEGRITVNRKEVEASGTTLPKELRRAIDRMADRLRDLHTRQVPASWLESKGGLTFGEVVRPLASVGCYVPGGRAAYPSALLMTAIPAKVAGVGRVVVCTPPRSDGSVPSAVLYAARVAGIKEIYRVGGAQAVAAMAYGTKTIARVDKIVGPGNAWVTAAKREVAGDVGIDGFAGPTELVVVADETAHPKVVAVDLAAQAEHDPLAWAVLVTWADRLIEQVSAALEEVVAASSREEIVRSALERSEAVLVAGPAEAAAVTDRLAPEHLQVFIAKPRTFLERVRAFGAAFLGPLTPVSFGDYGAGSNHVLPTMGTARFASGLRASDFVTISALVEASPESMATLGPDVEALARAEGLTAHARAVEVRR